MSWAAIGVAGVGAAAGIGGSMLGGGAKSHFMDPHLLYAKDYDWYAPTQRPAAELAQQQFRWGKEGRLSPGVASMLDEIERLSRQQVQEGFFGSPTFGPSVMQEADAAGARMGLGGAAAMAPVSKAQQQYGQRVTDLSQHMATARYDAYNNMLNQAYQHAQGMQQGPRFAAVGGMPMGTSGGGEPWQSQAMGMLPDLLDEGGALRELGSALGGGLKNLFGGDPGGGIDPAMSNYMNTYQSPPSFSGSAPKVDWGGGGGNLGWLAF